MEQMQKQAKTKKTQCKEKKLQLHFIQIFFYSEAELLLQSVTPLL